MLLYNRNKEKGLFKMNKNDLMNKLDELVEMFGADVTLRELAMTMTSKELEEDLKFMDRMDDLNLFPEDEK